MSWACFQLSTPAGLGSGLPGPALQLPMCLPLLSWQKSRGFHHTEAQGEKLDASVPSVLLSPSPPEPTPPSAFQFSNLREDKKHEEMMGIIEKDNILLRQVTARCG